MDLAVAAPPRHGRLLRSQSDEQLVARVRAGDEAAFEAVYDRHHRGLLAFCRHMLGTREEAEDALQHTFIAAYRALRSSDDPIALKAWLYAIARNRCLSMLRARREQASLEDVEPATEGLADEVQRRADLREMLGDLSRLPEEQRAALVLAELGAHAHEEIAVILGVRKEKVKALIFQARESLGASRDARQASCRDIQEQLATLSGGALRRTHIRRHVETCPACQAFRAEVKRQRAAMAVLLPVVPTVALKHSVLSAAFAAGNAGVVGAGVGAGLAAGTGVGAGTGATVGAGATGLAGSGGGLIGLGVKGLAAKVLLATAVAATAGGGGYVAVHELRSSGGGHPGTPSTAAPSGTVGGGQTGTLALPSSASNGIGHKIGHLPKPANHGHGALQPGHGGTAPGQARKQAASPLVAPGRAKHHRSAPTHKPAHRTHKPAHRTHKPAHTPVLHKHLPARPLTPTKPRPPKCTATTPPSPTCPAQPEKKATTTPTETTSTTTTPSP
jgi:RNA polymerase sigma factor (sigma-70 family)